MSSNHLKIIRLKTVDSTHTYAINLIGKKLIFNKERDIYAIIAESQTNGVGRCKRSWLSPKGNLYTSIIITELPEVYDLGKLSLAAACAVRETIAYYVPDTKDLRLRWPNDVYYKGKKISGILISAFNDRSVISVGINVNLSPIIENHDTDTNYSRSSICIKEILSQNGSAPAIIPENVLIILMENIKKWCLNYTDFSIIKSYWLRNINEVMHKIVINNGNDCISGVFLDIDDLGRVVLEREDGSRLFISSGDLFCNQEGIVTQNE